MDACQPSVMDVAMAPQLSHHSLASFSPAGSVKFEKRMYFLESDRRYCRTYNSLEASVQNELSFYKQKAKEWAEVHTQLALCGGFLN